MDHPTHHLGIKLTQCCCPSSALTFSHTKKEGATIEASLNHHCREKYLK